jgi:fructose-1,6-bisphosphatase/sedoheptulose 1,7-bisphosphatase-like protein
MISKEENNAIKQDMDKAIKKLESMGIDKNDYLKGDVVGLGDIVESALSSIGITEERFKQFFNLKECNCSKRKAWLNSLFSWKKNQG